MTQQVTSEFSWNSKRCEPHQDTQVLLFLEGFTHAINGGISQEHFSLCDFFFSTFWLLQSRRTSSSYGIQIQRTWQEQEEVWIFSPVTALCKGSIFISLQQTIKSYWTKRSAFLSESSGITEVVLQRWQTAFWYLVEPLNLVYLIYNKNPVVNAHLHSCSAYLGLFHLIKKEHTA